jgi:Skp family chaperone for outer membrane proteins
VAKQRSIKDLRNIEDFKRQTKRLALMRFVMTATIVEIVAVVGVVGVVAVEAEAGQTGDREYAFIDVQRVASESNEGQAANTRVDELSQQKLSEIESVNTDGQAEIATLNQDLLEAQERLQQGQNVISQEAAATLQRQIARLQRDAERTNADLQAEIQRMSQDAEAEVQELQQQLQLEFERRLLPAIDQIATEKGLAFILSAQQGLVWADPSLDLSQELIDLLNAPETP